MKVFEPIKINEMEIKNRILMAPIATNFSLRSKQSQQFYEERAKGGVGAITLGATNIDAFFSKSFMDGVKNFVIDNVHRYDVKIGPELWQGNLMPSLPMKGIVQEWVAPSAGSPVGGRSLSRVLHAPSECYCRELTVSEIQEIIGKFADSAKRAKETGFDYITVHGGHGHNLADQFFSPRDNRRGDDYGGNLEGRMRFGLELSEALRKAVGEKYPIFWRMSAEHFLPGGHTLGESVQYAEELVKAGVDVIDVSIGHEETYISAPRPLLLGADENMGGFISYANAFKNKLNAPIIGVGRIHNLEVAEEIIRDGKADMVNVGRQLLADPHWVEKIRTKRVQDINPCQCCNTCIWTFREEQAPIKCVINPGLGKESEYVILPAEKKKKVVVVGGGPAGMEAAIITAKRGHNVTLFEKDEKLGGLLRWQEKLPQKPTIKLLIDYLCREVNKAGVQVNTGTKCSPFAIVSEAPDTVIIAAGSKPIRPDIPGAGLECVVSALDILMDQERAGDRIVMIGGGLVACDTAALLAEQGKKVTILEKRSAIAPELYPFQSHEICIKLGAKGVDMWTNVKSEEIVEESIIVTDRWGRSYEIEADTIIIAVGSIPEDHLLKELRGVIPELYGIGDCIGARRMMDAFHEGAEIGFKI